MLAAYLGCLGFSGVLLAASVLGAVKDQGADGHGDGGHDHGHDHDGHVGHDATTDQLDAGGHEAGEAAGDADHGDAEPGADGHDPAGDHGHDHAHDAVHAATTAAHSTAGDIGTVLLATLLSLRFWTYALAAFGLTGTLLTVLSLPELLTAGLASGMGVVCGGGVSWAMRVLNRGQASGSVSTRELAGRDAEVVIAVGPGKLGKIRLTHQGQIVELIARTSEDRLLERKEQALVVEVRDGVAEITSPKPHPKPQRQPISN